MKVRVVYWTRHERVWPTKGEAKEHYDERYGVMVESIEVVE